MKEKKVYKKPAAETTVFVSSDIMGASQENYLNWNDVWMTGGDWQ